MHDSWPRTSRSGELADVCEIRETLELRGTEDARLLTTMLPLVHADRIYVPDHLGHDIKVYDLRGRLLHRIGGKGSAAGQFELPTDVQVSPDGHVYVNDRGNGRVQVLAGDYSVQGTYPAPGQNEQLLLTSGARPGFIVQGVGRCATGTCLLREFDSDGRPLRGYAEVPDQTFMYSWRSTRTRNGSIHIANVLDTRIDVYNARGRRLRSIKLASPGMMVFRVTPQDAELPLGVQMRRLREEDHTRIRSLTVFDDRLFVQFQRYNAAAGTPKYTLDIYDDVGRLQRHSIVTPGVLTQSSHGLYFTAWSDEGNGSIVLNLCR